MVLVCEPALALPEHRIQQEEFIAALRLRYAEQDDQLERKLALIRHTEVRERYFVRPLDSLFVSEEMHQRIARYMASGTQLATRAIAQALEQAQIRPRDIHYFILTSCTLPGMVLPGLDAYIVESSAIPQTAWRVPCAQMGCQAGAWALGQAYFMLHRRHHENALICNVEISSLNDQPDQRDASSYISRGLFGDAATAVVVQSDDMRSGLRLLGAGQFLIPGTLHDMEYEYPAKKRETPTEGYVFCTRKEVVPGLRKGFFSIREFLELYGYGLEDLQFFVAHTGGPKVLRTLAEDLRVSPHLLNASWDSLHQIGNVSSCVVPDVLRRTFHAPYRPNDSDAGLVLGFGPGSTIVQIFGEWQEA